VTEAKLLKRFDDVWQNGPDTRTECPPSFKRLSSADDLSSGEYVITHSALCGVPYSLFLLRVDGKDFSLLIDRKRTLYQVPVAAQSCFFSGSLFHGELVWSESSDSQVFLVLDVVCVKGDGGAIGKEPLSRRLEVVRHAFDLYDEEVIGCDAAHARASQGKIVCGGNAFGLIFYPKSCISLSMLPTLYRKATGGIPSRGFVVLPEKATVFECFSSGRHHEWDDPTVNVEVNATERIMRLRRGAPPPGATCFECDSTFWADLRASHGGEDSPVHVVARCLVRAGQPLKFVELLRDRLEGDSGAEAEKCIVAAANSANSSLEVLLRRR
jgi:hypothetical protein